MPSFEMELPDNLENYLTEREATVENVLPHTQKTIHWYDDQKKHQTDLSIVYLHGYSACRQEVSPLCEHLSQAIKANIFFTRLSGHGVDNEALARVAVDDWLQDTVEAVKIGQRLGKKVIIIGTSTGATLATWYLATYPQDDAVAAAIMISPNFGPKPIFSEILLWPLAKYYAPWIVGKEWSVEPLNADHEKYWYCRYPTIALIPMMKLVQKVRRMDVSKVSVPIQMILSQQDAVVYASKTKKLFDRLPGDQKEIHWVTETFDKNQHVLVGDVFSPQTVSPFLKEIQAFLKKYNLVS